MAALITVLLLSYLIGSIPSSLWMGKLWSNLDIRNHGSGNAGATNTFRVLGWKPGVIVLLIDFGKGLLTTTVISQFAWQIASGPVSPAGWEVDSFLRIGCGVMAVIGHMYPLYASFDGGKGAATAAGMLYGIEPISISITLVVFVSVIWIWRYVSLGTILATLTYPVSQVVLVTFWQVPIDPSVRIFSGVLAAWIILKHRANMGRLWRGEESRVPIRCSRKEERESPEEGEGVSHE
ncbi:MAG: glycerol-3-phosphate 1-O-acyltransferase PlsY [Balneolaceae bacterium]